MSRFAIATEAFEIAPLRQQLLADAAGASASFEGWVRDHNDGRAVQGLFYESYRALAESEFAWDVIGDRYAAALHRGSGA